MSFNEFKNVFIINWEHINRSAFDTLLSQTRHSHMTKLNREEERYGAQKIKGKGEKKNNALRVSSPKNEN